MREIRGQLRYCTYLTYRQRINSLANSPSPLKVD
jgi:hypothetical protein